jgi:hypothetical protein
MQSINGSAFLLPVAKSRLRAVSRFGSKEGRALRLIDDEQLGPFLCEGTVRLLAIRYLIAHTGDELDLATVFEFSNQFSFKAQENVTLQAPMIREISGRVFNHSNAYGTELLTAPIRHARFAFVFCRFNAQPIRRAERYAGYLHIQLQYGPNTSAQSYRPEPTEATGSNFRSSIAGYATLPVNLAE